MLRSGSTALLACALLLTAIPALAQPTITPIAMSGDPAPGPDPTATFSSFWDYHPSLNDAGHVTFHAWTTGTVITGGRWAEVARPAGSPVLSLVAGFGQPVAGSTKRLLGFVFDPLPFSSSSQLADSAGLFWPLGITNAVVAGGPGTFKVYAEEFEPTSPTGVPNMMFGQLSHAPLMNDRGVLTFRTNLVQVVPTSPPIYGHGIWTTRNGGVVPIAVSLEDDDWVWDAPSYGEPRMNDLGDIIYTTFSPPPTPDDENSAIVVSRFSGLSITFLREGDPAPGTPGEFGNFSGWLTINNKGDIGIHNGYRYQDLFGMRYGNGIWVYRNFAPPPPTALPPAPTPSSELVIDFTTTAPPGATGTDWYNPGANLSMNNLGQIAFASQLIPDGHGIWSDAGNTGTVGLVVKNGQTPPGVGSGFQFGGIFLIGVNDNQKVAFRATYTDSSSFYAGQGIWIFDGATGTTSLLIKSGDSVQISPGVTKTVWSIFVAPSQMAGSVGRAFNHADDVVAVIRFTDDTQGVFVINPN